MACLVEADYDTRRSEIDGLLAANPLLACYVRKQENFPLFRFVLERHRELGNIDDAAYGRRIEVIDLIESVEAEFGPPPEPMPLPEPIASDDDARLAEIVERWKGHLAWIRDDETMGPVVDKLIEYAATGK